MKAIEEAEPAPNVEGKAYVGWRHVAPYRRQAVEIGLEVDEILIGHVLVGRVRKGRIKIGPVGCHAAFHRGDEVERGPIADAGPLVGRNIGHVERAEWGLQAAASDKLLRILDLEIVAAFERGRMTLGAAAHSEQIFAIGKIGRVLWQRRCRHHNGDRHEIEDGKASDGDNEEGQQSSTHRPPLLRTFPKRLVSWLRSDRHQPPRRAM